MVTSCLSAASCLWGNLNLSMTLTATFLPVVRFWPREGLLGVTRDTLGAYLHTQYQTVLNPGSPVDIFDRTG